MKFCFDALHSSVFGKFGELVWETKYAFVYMSTIRLLTQGFGFENKGTEALSFMKLMGVFSGSQQVSALRGVCGISGVKRVVCR